MAVKQYWLMKTEPDTFSIEDLERKRHEPWDGVRNYQARNYMRDQMRKGDLVLIYHSSANPTGVAGVAKVYTEGHPDNTAWDPDNKHFDPKSSPENPIWFRVEVEFVERFPEVIPLEVLKKDPALEGMLVTKRGMRLSVQPVSQEHFDHVRKVGRRPPK
jgi:predicted RNA-binding protein with PUA-like domain